MIRFSWIRTAGLSALVGLAAIGTAVAQQAPQSPNPQPPQPKTQAPQQPQPPATQPGQPKPPPSKPQANTPAQAPAQPNVNVQVPGANVQVQTPKANVQVGNTGYYSQTPWFSNPEVREQLQLNEQQYNQLNQAYTQAWNRYNQGWTQLGANLTPEQRAQQEAQLRANFERDFNPAVSAVFVDPAARQRYNQLYLQYQGYGAFQDPYVQKQLNLTPQQQQQFNQFANDWNRQYSTWVTTYPANRERVGKAFREARRDARHRITTVLTPAQQTTWTNMTGQTYEFHPDVYFPTQTTTTTTLKPVVP